MNRAANFTTASSPISSSDRSRSFQLPSRRNLSPTVAPVSLFTDLQPGSEGPRTKAESDAHQQQLRCPKGMFARRYAPSPATPGEDAEFVQDEPQDPLNLDDENTLISGSEFVSMLADMRSGERVTKIDFMTSFLASVDLGTTDSKLIDLFKSSGIPRRIVPLIGCMEKSMPWFKDLRKLFKAQIMEDRGVVLQDRIQAFMTLVQSNAQNCSAHAATSVTIHELIQFRSDKVASPEQLVSSRTVKFWREYLWTPDDELGEAFENWNESKSASVQVNLADNVHSTPGGNRLRHDNPDSVGSLLIAVKAMIKFVSPKKALSVNLGAMIDQLLIRGRQGHPFIMRAGQSAESWIDEEQTAVDNIEMAAASIGRTGIFVSEIDRVDNLQSAASSKLWKIIEDQLVLANADYSELDFETAKTWLIDAQGTIDLLQSNRSGREKSNCSGTPKAPTDPDAAEAASPESEDSKKKKKKKKKQKAEGTANHFDGDPDASEAADAAPTDAAPDAEIRPRQTPEERAAMIEARSKMDCYHWINGSCVRGPRCHYAHKAEMKGTGSDTKQNHEVVIEPEASADATEVRPSEDASPESEDDEFEIERESSFDTRNPVHVYVAETSNNQFDCLSPIETESSDEDVETQFDASARLQSEWAAQVITDELDESMGQTEWVKRMISKNQKQSEIARLTADAVNDDPAFLRRDQRKARSVPKQQWTTENDDRLQMQLADVGNQVHQACDDSFLEDDASIDLGTEDENENVLTIDGQRTMFDFMIPSEKRKPIEYETDTDSDDEVTDMDSLCSCAEGSFKGQCNACFQCQICCKCSAGGMLFASTNSDDFAMCSCSNPMSDGACTRCLQCPHCCDCAAQHERYLEIHSRIAPPPANMTQGFAVHSSAWRLSQPPAKSTTQEFHQDFC